MNIYAPEKIRNIALVGHSGVGKTSLAEAMLYSTAVVNRLGNIADGTTKSDYTEAEMSRKISISTSMLHLFSKDIKINILDAPGYADFIGDAKAALWAVDNALLLVDAANGVEIGTDKAWGFAEEYGRSCVIFVNHVDKETADFDQVVAGIQERYGHGAIPFQFPVNPGEGFNQILDILQQKLFTYSLEESGKPAASDVPAELQGTVDRLLEQIIDAAAESDDALMEKYLEEGELTPDEISLGLKTGIVNRTLFPVLCGDASRNVGMDLLIDFLVRNLPSPAEMPAVVTQRVDSEETADLTASPDGPLAAIVFKTISESVGDLSFLRVYSGAIKPGDEVLNSSLKNNERTGQIYSLNGRDREEMDALSAGDIGALIKLKNTHTANTLCGRSTPLLVPPMEFPYPLIRIALKPRSRGDEEKISSGLQRIHEEDPSFIARYDPELRQIIVEGQGELHLDVVLQKLKQKFGVEVDTVEPKIPYRETITAKAEGHHRHKKQTGGRGQFGEVYLRAEPKGRGEGYEFEDKVVGGNIPGKYIPAIEKGIVEAMSEGVLAGYKTVDFMVTVYDGSYHTVDSSDMAFKLAGSQAFQKAFLAAKPILLEPIYRVRVTVPEKYTGDVMGDLNSRRGRIQGMDPEGHFQVIHAEVPLAELYKYSTSLRSMTQGTGDYTMALSHYEQVPHDVTLKVIEMSKKEQNEEDA